MNIHCIIVDDEQPAREVLENYIQKVPTLKLEGCFQNAMQALQAIQQQQVDLIFLDIQMPDITGVQFFKALSRPPRIIFTTAFSEYAVEGFDLGASDYLLKPFSFERFLKAVTRVMLSKNAEHSALSTGTNLATPANVEKPSPKEFLFLKADKAIHKVSINNILYFQSWGNYSKVFIIESQILLVHNSLSSFEELLSEENFLRVHKSFLINMNNTERLEGNRIFVKEHEIPIGEVYRREVQSRLNSNSKSER